MRQDAVFDGTEKRREGTGEKQHHQVKIGIIQPQGRGTKTHGANFNKFYAPCDEGFVIFVGKLAGDGREQEIRQDEQGGSRLHKQRGVPALVNGEIKGDENGDGIAQAIVIEGAYGLGHE